MEQVSLGRGGVSVSFLACPELSTEMEQVSVSVLREALPRGEGV